MPDTAAMARRYPKRNGEHLEFGYPLLRLVVGVLGSVGEPRVFPPGIHVMDGG
ncbi:hypothetical protein ACFLIM_44900 [Nonomuraea sp. M3C6]|uniref:Uncharacterized protein n=1 Tax=Nonomuraea marmarensis TaxID=3351344 RepID=A0ABW7ASE2_9ACTN